MRILVGIYTRMIQAISHDHAWLTDKIDLSPILPSDSFCSCELVDTTLMFLSLLMFVMV